MKSNSSPTYRALSTVCSISFAASVAIAVGCIAYPLYVVRPFREQGPRELALALELIRYSTWLVPTCVALAVALGLALWRRIATGRRLCIVVGLVLVILALVGSRVNIFEYMFKPDSTPRFITSSHSWIQDDDMVLAIRLNGQDRAYPIRQMAYHHLVNDVMGNQPVVATY